MKKVLLFFLVLGFSSCLYAEDWWKTLYENDKLLVEQRQTTPQGMGGYSHVFYYFTNKTSNTLRVNYKLKVRFVHAGPKDLSKTGTLYLKHNERQVVYSAELDPSSAHSSAIIPIDFQLINFSEKIENKEVPW